METFILYSFAILYYVILWGSVLGTIFIIPFLYKMWCYENKTFKFNVGDNIKYSLNDNTIENGIITKVIPNTAYIVNGKYVYVHNVIL